MKWLLRSVRLTLFNTNCLCRCFQFDAIKVQMKWFNLFQTTTRPYEYSTSLKLRVTGYLEVIFFLTNKCFVGIGKVKAFVSIHPIMGNRSMDLNCNEKRIIRKLTYKSWRAWSHNKCQFCCWKGEKRMHCIEHESPESEFCVDWSAVALSICEHKPPRVEPGDGGSIKDWHIGLTEPGSGLTSCTCRKSCKPIFLFRRPPVVPVAVGKFDVPEWW